MSPNGRHTLVSTEFSGTGVSSRIVVPSAAFTGVTATATQVIIAANDRDTLALDR